MTPKPRAVPQDLLPLKPPILMILAALVDGHLHGYRLKRVVEERSAGAMILDPGTLYRYIGSLMDERLIVEVPPPPDADSDDARRRYYALSSLGREVLLLEANRLAQLVDSVRASGILKSRTA